MNKKILALVIASVATGASASTIYENDQTTVGLKGEIDAYLSTSEVEDSAASDYKNDPDTDVWAKIQIDVDHQLNDEVTIFGSFEIENGVGFGQGDGDSKSVSTDDEYIGAQFGENIGFAVGEIGDFGDSLDAIIIDNTNEGTGYVDDVAGKFESKGHGISLKYATDNLTLIADTYTSENEGEDAVYGVSASFDIAGFNLGASYQDRGNRASYNTTNTGDNDIYGFKAGYEIAGFSVDAHYVVEQVNSVDTDVIGVSAAYKIDDARLYASTYTADEDAAGSEDVTAYTVGVDYAISENLTGFVEYTANDNYGHEDGAEYSQSVAGVYFAF